MTASGIGGGAADGPETLIDAGSAISVEEQREILAQINGIAEKNRSRLSSGRDGDADARGRLATTRNGRLFPLLVNAFAAIALIGGSVALFALQSGADARAREGTRVFGDVERALIEEIRRETGALLAAKDREISAILLSLAGVQARILELDGAGALGEEQTELYSLLSAERDARGAELEAARLERSLILENARARESVLQAQLDARAREAAAVSRRIDGDLGAAHAELAELAADQALASAVGDQVASLFSLAHELIAAGRFDEAERAIGHLREFLDAQALRSLRSMPARREIYGRAADTLEALLVEHRLALAAPPGEGAPDGEAGLREELAALRAELASARDALVSGDAGAEQAISQYRGQVAALQGSLASRNQDVQALEAANASLGQTVAARDGAISALQGSLAAQSQAADGLRQDVQALEAANAALGQTVAARDGAVGALQAQNDALASQLAQAQLQIQQIQQVLQGLLE